MLAALAQNTACSSYRGASVGDTDNPSCGGVSQLQAGPSFSTFRNHSLNAFPCSRMPLLLEEPAEYAKSRPNKIDPVWLAQSKLRRAHYDQCANICTEVLQDSQLDQAVWYLKCRALTLQNALDDTELEDEGVAEVLLDDNATATVPRPGTSTTRSSVRPGTASSGPDQGIRPVTASGRPLTGFAVRPSTASGPSTGSLSVDQAFRGARPGTSRALTAMGREVRLGTASLAISSDGTFIDVQKLNMKKFATRPPLAVALVENLLHSQHDVKRALELSAEATEQAEFKQWYWKTILGKCYYRLGLYRDAERQLRSSLKDQDMVVAYLELVKVYLKLDLPNSALEVIQEALRGRYEDDTRLVLGMARVYEMIRDSENSIKCYKKVLLLDPSNVEAIACLAAQYFYTDQPELGLRFYRRLLQMGVTSTELWNNLGLSCFYASQYDLALSCFERALAIAADSAMADVWHNIGQVAIAIGDVGLAYQAFKIATSVDNNHAESYCNLGVLEQRRQHYESARAHFNTAQKLGPHLFEPFFNGALLAYKLGEFQESFTLAQKSESLYPEHSETKELLRMLRQHLFS